MVSDFTKVQFAKVIKFIEDHPEHFSMGSFVSGGCFQLVHRFYTLARNIWGNCGTTLCIGGTAAFLSYLEAVDGGRIYINEPIDEVGAKFLGINSSEAAQLFYARIWNKYAMKLGLSVPVDLDTIKPEQAITMLKNLSDGTWEFDQPENPGV